MRENVGSQGFGWYLVSKSSWSPPTFQRFSPEFSQQSTKSRKFHFQIAPFRKTPSRSWISARSLERNSVKIISVWIFSSDSKGKKGFILQRGFFGMVYLHTCSQIMEKTAAKTPCLQSFCFSKIVTYRSCQLTHIVHPHVTWDFLQFCSFTMAELRWKGVACVKIAWMIKKAYFSWRLWFVVSQ